MPPFPSHEAGPAAAGQGQEAERLDAHAGARARLARMAAPLDAADERDFGRELDRALASMLPALGAAFGAGVILFSVWDYWISPPQAATTTMVRLALVLVGALGYFSWHGRIAPAWRCGIVYGTHCSAMILSAALLPDGLVLALPAITGVMFPLALVEPRLPRLLLLVLFPSLLFLVLCAAVLPPPLSGSCALVYLVTLGLALAVANRQGRWRRAAFLTERALAYCAHHDSLSGVLARGYLVELATHDVALARRYRHPLAIGMLDIDYFKQVNDTYGHLVGDALIRAVCQACSAQLRASDYFGRIGGEEFACVMPETDENDALACAERMRMAVAAIRIETPTGSVRCTISVGIAALAPEHADFEALLAAADAALYHAKSTGRDRVELAPRPR